MTGTKDSMRIGRTIFAVLIGLSVALLPASVGFASAAKSTMGISAADCDHRHNAASDDIQKSTDDSACIAACALNCFNFTEPAIIGIAYSLTASAALEPARKCRNISSLMNGPPFRPPRS